MGKYRHGPVHYKKKKWKSKADNLKQEAKRIAENRAVLARVATSSSEDRS